MARRQTGITQSGEILQIGGAWQDGDWAAIRGLKVERSELEPATFFLRDAEQVRALLKGGMEQDDFANPFALPLVGGKADPGRYHIGVLRIGGKGDDIMTGATCVALKRRFPQAFITLFARDNTGQLAGHPAIDRLVFGAQHFWHEVVRDLRERFDAFVDMESYVPKVWVFRPEPELREWGRECNERYVHGAPLEGVAGYAWFHLNFPRSLHKLNELQTPLIELTNDLLGLETRRGDVTMTLGRRDRQKAAILHAIIGDYVVLHNGAACGRQTKCWPTERWEAVVKALRADGVHVVQIGTTNEECVAGCVDLRGLTSVPESAGIIEGARLLLDTEGGPAHMAAALGTPAVILFGPTLARMFGHEGQVQVSAGVPCEGCWYSTDDWHLRCPKGYSEPLCMASITTEQVIEAARQALREEAGEQACSECAQRAFEAADEGQVGAERSEASAGAQGQELVLSDVAIAVPTRNRPAALRKLLESIGRQTVQPGCVLIVDDGDGMGYAAAKEYGYQCINGPARGPHFAHQAALEALADYEYILRLDDDVVLESLDFIARLYSIISSDRKIGAVGGVYPQPEHEQVRMHFYDVGLETCSNTVEGMLAGYNHCQFFRYAEDWVGRTEHLYSSFMYRRSAALEVGGFPLCYSPRGHREETDFSYRLHLARYLMYFDTGAVARHERCATGGLRDLADGAKLTSWRRSDEQLFLERLRGGVLRAEACGRTVTA